MSPKHEATLEPPPINPIPMQYGAPVWAGMNPSIGVVTHLHGARVQGVSDGWPLHPASFPGNPYELPSALPYRYTNDQRSCMLWFHDHAMDNTAVQVHAGLAGLYFIRDKADDEVLSLVGGAGQEIPLVLQDRKFACGFDKVDYWAGVPTFPDDFDRPEYLGDTIFVNGRPSPFHEVERKICRLRVLNGSHARTFALALIDPAPWNYPAAPEKSRVGYSDLLTVIGNDGGLFAEPHRLGQTDHILLAPGERLDLLLDLSGVEARKDDMGAVIADARLAARQSRRDFGASRRLARSDLPDVRAAHRFPRPRRDPNGPAPSVASSVIALDDSADRDARRAQLASIAAIRRRQCFGVLRRCDEAARRRASTRCGCRAFWRALRARTASSGATASCKRRRARRSSKNRFVVLMNDAVGNRASKRTHSPATRTNGILTRSAPGGTRRSGSSRRPIRTTAEAPSRSPSRSDLDGSSPPAGLGGRREGTISSTRASWFDKYPPERLIDDRAGARLTNPAYAKLHAPAARRKAGTYERWYVANIGNAQPLLAGAFDDTGNLAVPDMHPFHMHLVNFVVTGRWRLQADTNRFAPADEPRANDFDGLCRHDTVRVQSNELLELLVFFPPGYTGATLSTAMCSSMRTWA